MDKDDYVTPESGIYTEGSFFSGADTPISLHEIPKMESPDVPPEKAVESPEEQSSPDEKSCCKFFQRMRKKTFKPYSNAVFYWLMTLTLSILYNLWSIPVRATFISEVQVPYQYVWFTLDAISDTIYAIDALVKFRTEVFAQGIYHTDLSRMNSHHVRDWSTVLDILSVLPTDFFFIITTNPLLRLNRVLRLYRMTRFSQLMESRISSPFSWRLLTSCHRTLVVFHYNACLYYALSVVRGFGLLTTSWAYPNPVTYPSYDSLHMKYGCSFFRSLQLLNFVGGQTAPEEDWQFSYSILCIIIGMVTLAAFIGCFVKDIIGKDLPRLSFQHEMLNTKYSLQANDAPKSLRNQVDEYYQHAWISSDFNNMANSANSHKYLPATLSEELNDSRFINVLKQVKSVPIDNETVMRNLASNIESQRYLPRQVIRRNDKLGFIGNGQVHVVRNNDGVTTATLEIGDTIDKKTSLISNQEESFNYISVGFTEILYLNNNLLETFKDT